MESKRTFGIAASATFGVGTLAVLLVFLQSLQPSEKSLAELPRLLTSNIPAGSYVVVPSEVDEQWLRRKGLAVAILMLRDLNGKLHAFYISTKDTVPTIPVDYFPNGGPLCNEFVPSFQTNDIACRASVANPELVGKHRWSFSGKNLTGNAMDLDVVQGSEENGFFVLHKQP